jgi:hypothetical protein
VGIYLLFLNFIIMKKLKLDFQHLKAEVLTRSQLKQILGGDGSTGGGSAACCENGQIAHCYGTTSNCTGAAYGSCDNGANCLEYCVVTGQSQYWC